MRGFCIYKYKLLFCLLGAAGFRKTFRFLHYLKLYCTFVYIYIYIFSNLAILLFTVFSVLVNKFKLFLLKFLALRFYLFSVNFSTNLVKVFK